MEKMRQWMILTALGVVGVMAAGWFLLVSPQRAHAGDLRTQAASEQSATAGLQSQIAQLKQQQKGEPAQQKRLMQIAGQIPDNPQMPTLIRELSVAAHAAGVSLDSLSPQQPTLMTAAATTTGTAAATSATAAPLAQIQVSISVTGSYFNIESFMRSLEHLDRALKSTGLTLNPGSGTADSATGAAPSAAPDALTGQIQAIVFETPSVLPAAGAQTAAPAATAPAQPTTTTPAQSGTSGQ
jgi:Tfp pilus assembly protein PilO